MRTLDSFVSWTNPDPPSTPSYAAIARHVARRGLATLPFAGIVVAIQFAGGQYAIAALVVGTLLACAVAVVAGAAVAFDDAAVAVVATAGTAVAVVATAMAARLLGLGDGQMLGIFLALIVVPGTLAAGTGGYTVAERTLA